MSFHNEFLLFDITSIITFNSDICRNKVIQNNLIVIKKIILEQIQDEQKDPVFCKIENLYKNNKILITKSTHEKVKEMISDLGSENEKKNLLDFLNNVKIIEDDPSEHFINFKEKIWTKYNINIFGTAYKHNYIIVTGNINALNNLLNEKNLEIKFIAHRSRCFVGKNFEN